MTPPTEAATLPGMEERLGAVRSVGERIEDDAPRDPRDPRAFPRLDEQDMRQLKDVATTLEYRDGEEVFKFGDPAIPFYVVESGGLEIINPRRPHPPVTIHGPGEFAGDIDLLTRRPVIVTAIARGATRLLRVPNDKLREMLNVVPRLGEKLLVAFQVRREMITKQGAAGLKVIGPGHCKDTNVVREFLYKNFVPFVWYDTDKPEGRAEWEAAGSPKKTPVVDCGENKVLLCPSLHTLADCAGIWHGCPDAEYELAVVGGGPAGIAAAVYAASEGVRTVVLDRLGPGGQAAASSKIENFIGFPAGLSGSALATRGVLQMLKFGARMVAPVNVQRLEPGGDGEPHKLKLDCGATIRADTILVATGVSWRRLDVPGASRFDGAGVYYACTMVEAERHKDSEVAVVGGGNSAGQAAMFLAEQCKRQVHLLVRRDDLGYSMSEYLCARIRGSKSITVHTGVEVSEVFGDSQIEAIEVRRRSDGGKERFGCSAVFVFIGADPQGEWLPGDVARDKLGYLLTGAEAAASGRWPLKHREPCPLETTLPRLLAAGDIRAGSTKRVGFAVGDGSLAVTCTHKLRMVKD